MTVERTVPVPDELTTLETPPAMPEPLTNKALKSWTFELIAWAIRYEHKLVQIANLPTDEDNE